MRRKGNEVDRFRQTTPSSREASCIYCCRSCRDSSLLSRTVAGRTWRVSPLMLLQSCLQTFSPWGRFVLACGNLGCTLTCKIKGQLCYQEAGGRDRQPSGSPSRVKNLVLNICWGPLPKCCERQAKGQDPKSTGLRHEPPTWGQSCKEPTSTAPKLAEKVQPVLPRELGQRAEYLD